MVRTEFDSVFFNSLCILSSSPLKSAVALVLGRTDSPFFFLFFFFGQFFYLFMHGSFALTSRDLSDQCGVVKDYRFLSCCCSFPASSTHKFFVVVFSVIASVAQTKMRNSPAV